MSALGRLVASIVLDSAEFTAGTDKARYAAAKMASDIDANFKSMEGKIDGVMGKVAGTLAGAFSAGAFIHLIKGAIDSADHLQDLSKTTSIAVETLSGLGIAAKQSGGDLDSIAASINKLSVNMGKDAEKFKALGITAKDPLEAFKQLADVFNAIHDPQLRAAVGAEALGKAWAGAAPLLAEGGRKIGEMVDRGAALTGVTAEMAKQADELNDKWVLLVGTGGLVNSLVKDMLPLLNLTADGLIAMRDGADKAGEGFKPVAEALRAIVIVAGNVGFVLKAIGTEIGTIAAQLGALVDILAAVAARQGPAASAALARFNSIHEDAIKNAEAARTAFDRWEEGILAVGTAARSSTTALDAMDQVSRRMASDAGAAARDAAAKAKAFLDGQKAAKEAAAEKKRLQELDDKGWVASIDATTKEYEDGLNQLAKFSEEFYKNEERLRNLDNEGWVKYIDAMTEEYESGLKAIGGMHKSHIEEVDEDTKRNAGRQIGQYAQIAGAAKGFFNESSKGYKALEAAERTFQAFQLASDLVKGISAAAVAVADQAQGDPYTAWGRMALMAAAMAALGFAVAGGGGGGTHVAGSVGMQASQGTGTVFGDTTAKSESIANALETLRDNSSDDLLYTSRMLASLLNIESSMSGMAAAVVRSQLTGAGVKLPGSGGGNTFALDNAGIILGRANTPGSSEADQGYSGQTVAQLISGAIVTGFTDVARTHSGAFGSTYTAVNREQSVLPQGDALISAIGRTVKGISDAIGQAVVVLTNGAASIDDINKILADVHIDPMSISFADLKGSALVEALSSVFSALGDTMVGAILSSSNIEALQDFQHVGEGAFETLVRVASGVERARSVLDQWGIAIIDWQNIANTQGDVTTELIRGSVVLAQTHEGVVSSIGQLIQSFDGTADDIINLYKKLMQLGVLLRASAIDTSHLSQAMITAAGGLSALQSGLEAYSKGFFTAEEQAAFAHDELVTSFEALGQILPTTREAFRAMVEMARAAGDDKLLGALLRLAPAFANLVPAVAAATGAANAGAGGLQPWQQHPYGYDDPDQVAARALAEAAKAAAEFGKALDAARQPLKDWLHSLMLNESLSPLTPEARLDFAHNAYVENLLKAQGGDLDALSKQQQFGEEYLKELRSSYGSRSEYLQGYAGVVEQTKGLAGLADAARPTTAADTKAAGQAIIVAIQKLQEAVESANAAMPGHLSTVTKPLQVLEQAVKDGASVFGG